MNNCYSGFFAIPAKHFELYFYLNYLTQQCFGPETTPIFYGKMYDNLFPSLTSMIICVPMVQFLIPIRKISLT